MADDKLLGLNWSAVEKALAEGTFSGYKIGILETEKLLREILKAKDIPGSTTERKIKYIRRFLSLPDKLDYSRHIFERILEEPHFVVSREETKQIVSGYWQAMLDIEEAVATLGLKNKIMLRGRYFLGSFLRNLRNVTAGILAASALIWFLAETSWGKKSAALLAQANHFFIFTFLLWTIIVLLSLLVLGGILYFLSSRQKKF